LCVLLCFCTLLAPPGKQVTVMFTENSRKHLTNLREFSLKVTSLAKQNS